MNAESAITAPHPLDRAVAKLSSHSTLNEAERAAVRGLPHILRTVDPATYLVREGELPEYCAALVGGFAFRHKVTGDGGRQIMSIHMPGDMVDLQNSFLDVSDHNVQTLTRAEVAFIPRPAIRDMAAKFPALGRAMWTDTLIDASIFREWVMNVGRRDALSRIAHLLCEFAIRLETAGLAEAQSYELPMTQEQLADAVGLTPVHVNRVLKELERLGLIVRRKRAVSIPDWQRLREAGDFSARYLHLGQGEVGAGLRAAS
jgi:CRP-like cAMP-binding protein